MVLCLKTRESRSLPDLPNIPPPFTQIPIVPLCSYAELFFILISPLRYMLPYGVTYTWCLPKRIFHILRYMLPYGVTYAWCLPKRIFHILRYMLPYGVTYTFNHAQSISHTLTHIPYPYKKKKIDVAYNLCRLVILCEFNMPLLPWGRCFSLKNLLFPPCNCQPSLSRSNPVKKIKACKLYPFCFIIRLDCFALLAMT